MLTDAMGKVYSYFEYKFRKKDNATTLFDGGTVLQKAGKTDNACFRSGATLICRWDSYRRVCGCTGNISEKFLIAIKLPVDTVFKIIILI
jgi:hypothetical protein